MHKKLWSVAALIASLLAGCASSFDDTDIAYNDSKPSYDGVLPRETGKSRIEENGQSPLECVPFARDHSGVQIFGDAYTWWDRAAAKYERSEKPESGAVMVLAGYAGPDRGHVAVVQKIISTREIRVDHANWLDDGGVYINDPVADVSADNDWSQVRVFNIQTGAWGGNVYPVKGFILAPGGAAPDADAPAPVLATHVQKPWPKTAEPLEPHDLTPDDRDLEQSQDTNAPVAAHVTTQGQKPLPKPRSAAPQATQPLGQHDLTPENMELEPESPANTGPVAMAETPKKAW